MDKLIEQTYRSLPERLEEIELLIDYAAPQDQQQQAKNFLNTFAHDLVALHIFHNFYSFLPEGIDDAITSLHLILRKDGVFIICANTLHDAYLYLANAEKAEYLGPLREGIWEEEVLAFFAINRPAFLKKYSSLQAIPEYTPLSEDTERCRICHVGKGEIHRLGCPVEICPWCGGQLTNCDCRFIKLETSRIDSEAQLQEFIKILEEKGRIPFNAKEQNLGFPSLD